MTDTTAKKKSKKRGVDQSLIGHLRELRSALFKILIGLLVGIVFGWIVYEPVFQFLQQPMLDIANSDGNRLVSVNFAGIGTAFTVQLKVACFIGVVVTCPWWVWQLAAFVGPGLLKRERKILIIASVVSVPLFLLGILLAWYFLPPSIRILTGFAPDFTATMVNAEVYFDFVLKMALAFGFSFLLPVVMVGLMFMGIVSSSAWLRGWRWATLLAFLFAAVASPSGDILTMSGLALPILVLYFGAIGIGAIHERRQVKRLEKGDFAGI